MVRGRKERNVPYPPSDKDDYPQSDKMTKIQQRRRIETKTNKINNQSITNYFKFKSIEINYETDVIIGNGDESGRNVDIESETILQEKRFIELNKTPTVVQARRDSTTAPLTPHRIELNEPEPSAGAIVIENQPSAKRQQPRKKKTSANKLTDYYPAVRRSERRTKTAVLEERNRTIEETVRAGAEDGLAVRQFDGKGRGVVALRKFFKGDFVVEYSGELIDINEARRREAFYSQDKNMGCYMYYFKHGNRQYCIDATAETGRLGRLVNHSRNGNLLTKTIPIDGKPRLVLLAKDTITEGEEVTYDYGDRSKESLLHHPWLAY